MYGPALRAAVCIDGFNLFHAINDLNEPHRKWLDLWRLSALLAGKTQSLKRVVWCSAEHPDPHKAVRYRAYREALKSTGVHVFEGHFTNKVPLTCKLCGGTHFPLHEKEGDIGVALHLMMDACEDVFDIAYLVSADSDQAATARLFRQRFAKAPKPKRLVTVAPPNKRHSKDIFRFADGSRTIARHSLEMCLFPDKVTTATGATIVRPARYDPPQGCRAPRLKPATATTPGDT